MMVRLQRRGVHNINFVTPTHFVPQILAALPYAIERGFTLPLVYNSSGYDSVETLRLLDGVIDIYLPDAKYAEDDVARRLSGFPGYVESNREALLEMFRQVGAELILDGEGIARRGMIVRHLVLPNGLAGSRDVFRWLAAHLSPAIHLSVMAQYFPAHHAVGDPVLGRRITLDEYDDALAALDEAGLDEGWVQDMDDEIL
jgi:putative pyruvate formate lyase activating enzyme